MPAEQNKNLSLLIVEDEPDLLEVLSELLSRHCNRVFQAKNGAEGLKIVQENPGLCAVLSDISMPEMNGLEMLAKIRSSFNPIPFVVLTAYGDVKNFQEAVRLNATDFLSKPIEHDALVEVMKRALNYGAEIISAEKELDELFRTAAVPPEKMEKIRRAKRTAIAMRIESSLYLKKPPQK